jgi:dihydroxyacetone kinase-like protein
MKKIMNRAEDFVTDVLDGIQRAHPDIVQICGKTNRVVVNKNRRRGKVALVTAGGSGHLPVFLGYVGDGLLDGCAVGNVFASPSSEVMLEMIKEVDDGHGVLCIYGNYGGDTMNFRMAQELASFEDITTAEVVVCDDVASAIKGEEEKRRGVAGMIFAFKIAGAAADLGMSLSQIQATTKAALTNIRTMGIAISPCIVPQVGKPTFTIGEDEIEIGMGIHGEPGIEVQKMMSAHEIAHTLLDRILADMPLDDGDMVSVMVNGLGSTPLEELYIVYASVHTYLLDRNIRVCMPHIGEFATSMEMAGLSITVFKLDEQMKKLLEAPASTPFFTNYNI